MPKALEEDERDSSLDSIAPGVLIMLDERRRLLDDGSEDEP